MSRGASGTSASNERRDHTGRSGGIDWQSHPSVNTDKPCPWCDTPALHEQHCKQICLACGWYRSCAD